MSALGAWSTRLAALGCLIASGLGCGDPAPPVGDVDADRGRRDAAIDASGLAGDAALDAGEGGTPDEDADMLDARARDAARDARPEPDATWRDAGPRPDAGPCETLDGGERCPCFDSRDCGPGAACEAGACVARRVGCLPVEGSDCPWGFVCDTTGAEPFCRRTLLRCHGDGECEPGWRCLDSDGDGEAECLADGACRTRSDCADGLVCATRPAERFASCERYGACLEAADCPAGMECRDLWGDGVRECVEPGGCTSQADCDEGAICGTPTEGGPPACLSRPLVPLP